MLEIEQYYETSMTTSKSGSGNSTFHRVKWLQPSWKLVEDDA